MHGAVLLSGPSCQQDGDRYCERLQPAAKMLLVLVVAAAAVVLNECLTFLSVLMNCEHFTLLISYKHLLRKRTVSTTGTSFFWVGGGRGDILLM